MFFINQKMLLYSVPQGSIKSVCFVFVWFNNEKTLLIKTLLITSHLQIFLILS